MEVLSRMAKNRYVWHGKSRIVQTLGKLKVGWHFLLASLASDNMNSSAIGKFGFLHVLSTLSIYLMSL